MRIPRTVEEFMADVASQTATGTVRAQDSFRRYLETSADTPCTYLTVWDTLRRAGLLASFDLQDAIVRASQAMLRLGIPPCGLLANRLVQPAPAWPTRMVRLTDVPGPHPEAPVRPTTSIPPGPIAADEFAVSALGFPPPLGIITSQYEESLDEEAQ